MVSIYCKETSNRLKYFLGFFFKEIIGVKYSITNLPQNLKMPIVNYSEDLIPGSIHIPKKDLLADISIEKQDWIEELSREVLLNPQDKQTKNFIFDIFSVGFYLLSRYEEYIGVSSHFDRHNRFREASSFTGKRNLTSVPLIDLWGEKLRNSLQETFPKLKLKKRQYNFNSSFDIDLTFAHKGKGTGRTIFSLLKSIKHPKIFKNKINVLRGKEKDPYDSYEYILNYHKKKNKKVIFFVQCGKWGRFDRNAWYKSRSFKQLVEKLNKESSLGIHPSYASTLNRRLFAQEKTRLENLARKKISKNRQHFLKIDVPDYYNNIEKLGINEDYSLGYAEKPGFRAGTCTPFRFFSLTENKETSILIIPLNFMECTMKDYMKLNKIESLEYAKEIIHTIRKFNGTFTMVWHNHTVSNKGEWKEWRNVFEQVFDFAIEYQDINKKEDKI